MRTYFILGSFMITATLCALEIKTELIEIQKADPSIIIDLRYATDNNFTKEPIYPAAFRCLLAKEPMQALGLVQKELKAKGLGLKVWDAYRPRSCQAKLWEVCGKQYPDEKERAHYVANPYNGEIRHARGYTVDVTIVDTAGKELPMPTEFDDFSAKAWSDCAQVDDVAKQNRTMLIEIMRKHGFTVAKSEWWHFDYQGWKDQPILDVVT